ncbi:esterase/lipase family protein [Agaribacterium sp. ZY112]|uniref:esterase/lipase family protein n=1 Tax=Agaribacterium sp. ZY112 TaxID=3233574 RepID=UPI003525FAE7
MPKLIVQLLGLLIIIFWSALSHASCVILLHGLARSDSSMDVLETRLSEPGYQTVNVAYPSRDFDIATLAKLAVKPALAQCASEGSVNFVTHSLGGILVRQYLSEQNIENLKYVVMLGPPNQGSEVVDKLQHFPGFHFINGDAGMQLGTAEVSVPNQLDAARFNVGVIAGNKSINLILSSLIPGVDDGKVSVEHTKLEGMNDHLVMPVTHTFMMKNKAVIEQVLHYLKHGQFDTTSRDR